MIKDIIKKADIALGVFLLIFCAATAVFAYGAGGRGADAVIEVNGELYGTYQLSHDRIIEIESEFGHNEAVIEDGKIYMAESDCPDSYCLGQHRSSGGIDSSNQTIVCLPNRVVISVNGDAKKTENSSGNDAAEIDGVSGGAAVSSSDMPDAVSGSPISDGGSAVENGSRDILTSEDNNEEGGSISESGNEVSADD